MMVNLFPCVPRLFPICPRFECLQSPAVAGFWRLFPMFPGLFAVPLRMSPWRLLFGCGDQHVRIDDIDMPQPFATDTHALGLAAWTVAFTICNGSSVV